MIQNPKDYAEIICQAVDEIVSAKIDSISFDKTELATITDAAEAASGKYKIVTDTSVIYTAYSNNTNYLRGDRVYITVPNGDYSQQKIIIGKYIATDSTPITYVAPFNTIVDATGNLILSDTIRQGLQANWPNIKEKMIWRREFDEEEMAGFTRLGIQGQFKSLLDEFDCLKGDYGLRLELICQTNIKQSEKDSYQLAIDTIKQGTEEYLTPKDIEYLKNYLVLEFDASQKRKDILKILEETYENLDKVKYSLYLSSKEMYGNPFNFISYVQQEKVFDISALGRILSMELFFYQAPGTFIDKWGKQVPYQDEYGNALVPNIFVKDPYVCLGFNLGDFADDTATIYTTSSLTYGASTKIQNTSKNIQLRWVHDGKVVDRESKLNREVRWYRYEYGAPSADAYSGVYWTRIKGEPRQTSATEGIIEKLKTYVLSFHSGSSERTYWQKFQVKYPDGTTLPLSTAENIYVKNIDQTVKDKYHLNDFEDSFFAYNYSVNTISKSDLQTWSDIFHTRMILHDRYHKIKDGYSGNSVSARCLHPIGFWELLTMSYAFYWTYRNRFDLLGVGDLWVNGGGVPCKTWDEEFKGKAPGNNLDLAYFQLNEKGKASLEAFANSFGEWKMVYDEEDGLGNYIPVNEETYKRTYSLVESFYKKMDEPTYIETYADSTSLDFIPDPKRQEEKIKAIIFYDENVIRSNTLTFTNEKEVISDSTAEYLNGLNIWCADGTYGNYYIYDPGNKILEQYRTNEAHKLQALFSLEAGLLETNDKAYLTEAQSITWTFNTENTMLEVNNIDYNVNYNNKIICAPSSNHTPTKEENGIYTFDLVDGSKVIYDDNEKVISITHYGSAANGYQINNEEYYFVKESYAQSAQNNVVQCKVVKDNVEYFTSKRFSFGQAGTTGTDVTLRLIFEKQALTTKDGGDTMQVKAMLFDSQNKEIDYNNETERNLKVSWSWYKQKGTSINIVPLEEASISTQDDYNQVIGGVYYNSPLRQFITLETSSTIDINTYLILEVKVTGWGDYPLVARRPVPVAAASFQYNNQTCYPSYIDGAEEVIYGTAGYPPDYYKEPWKLHYKLDKDANGSMDFPNCSWKIWSPLTDTLVYAGTFDEKYKLKPLSIYVKDTEPYGVQCYVNGVVIWSQPINILQNLYPSNTINEWDGKSLQLNTNEGRILAASISAGRKDNQNRFSGVMMGAWTKTSESSDITGQTGVYGFHEGAMSYALKEDGTAFIGKSGGGRILLDGNKSTIESASYSTFGKGIKIDLDDNLLDIKNGHGGIRFDNNDKLQIRFADSDGNNLFMIDGSNEYYLQSANFSSADGRGLKIDLSSGQILGYNLELVIGKNPDVVLTSNVKSKYYPFYAVSGYIGGFTISDLSLDAQTKLSNGDEYHTQLNVSDFISESKSDGEWRTCTIGRGWVTFEVDIRECLSIRPRLKEDKRWGYCIDLVTNESCIVIGNQYILGRNSNNNLQLGAADQSNNTHIYTKEGGEINFKDKQKGSGIMKVSQDGIYFKFGKEDSTSNNVAVFKNNEIWFNASAANQHGIYARFA